jgi:L-ascorbate metabolism protein UlaG (beta-lactamase superfamily)
VSVDLRLTYIGGPTVLLQLGGLRLLSDPTFDPAGAEFRAGAYVLRKTHGPGLPPSALGRVDAVLLSHDHHFDNLDASGRAFLGDAGSVLTTGAGAERLGGRARGFVPWQTVDLPAPGGRTLHVTTTPARHGPAHADRGPVVGFVLTLDDDARESIYLSGDTVWYEGVEEVSRRFTIRTAVLFMGAARVEAVGPWHLTFTAVEGVEAARAFAEATIVPVHFEDWEHFSESRPQIDAAFAAAGLGQRLRWLPRGVETEVAGQIARPST